MILGQRPEIDLPVDAVIVDAPELPVQTLIGCAKRVRELHLTNARMLGEGGEHCEASTDGRFTACEDLEVDVTGHDEAVGDGSDELHSPDGRPSLSQAELVDERKCAESSLVSARQDALIH